MLLAASTAIEVVAFTLARPLLTNLSGVAAALVLLSVALPSSRGTGLNRVARVLEWLPIRFTGLMSYRICLWHLLVILWLLTHHLMVGDNARSMPLNGLLVLGITVPLAALTYFLVERTAMRWRKSAGKARGGQFGSVPNHPAQIERSELSTDASAETVPTARR